MAELDETIKWLNSLQSTVEDMCSSNHNRRLLAEFNQVRIRADKLDAILTDYVSGALSFELDTKIQILYAQLQIMRAYEAVLEMRIENEVKNGN